MARSRNLKPSIFKNEILGTADPLYTILFECLWCLSDREGRLEDRPMRIKAEAFPYREGINADDMLSWLVDNKFILRYSHEGEKFIQIINFKKHQNPHVKENNSTIPAPGLNGASIGKSGTNTPDSLNPLTDSLNPITTRAPRKDSFVLPEWIDVKAWTEWEKFRIERKKPLSDLSRKKCVAVLEKHKEQQKEIIDLSIMNGWTGLFPPKSRGQNGTHQQDTRSRAKRFSDKLDDIARRDIEKNGFTDKLD